MTDLASTIKIGADASGVEVGVGAAKRSLASLGVAAAQAGQAGGDGLKKIGEGGEAAAKRLEASTRNTIASIQRQTAAIEAGGKGARAYQESIANLRGIDVNTLKPFLDQLDLAKLKAEQAAKATTGLGGSFGKITDIAAKFGVLSLAIGSAATALGLFRLASKIKDVIDLADGLNKLSQKSGVAVEALSALRYASQLADVGSETLATGLKKLNVNISAAAAGSKQQVAVFEGLGVSIKDAAGNALSADKVLSQIATRFSEAADGADKTAVAVALFGKAGAELIPLLNLGAAGLKAQADEATKLGLVLSGDFAKKAEEFNDNLRRISLSGQKVAITFAGDLVEGLGETVKAMSKAAIEGGKLHAVMVGLQTLFSGSAQFQNDKSLVEQSEKKFALEAGLQKLKAAGYTSDTLAIKSNLKQQAELDAQIKSTLLQRRILAEPAGPIVNGRRVSTFKDPRSFGVGPETLTQQERGSVQAGARALKEKEAATTSAARAYDTINKAIQERLALADQELSVGRALTDFEKFEIKTLTDLSVIKKDISAEERKAIDLALEKLKIADLALQIDKSEIANAKEKALARQSFRNTDNDSVAKFFQAEREAQNANIKALKDGNKTLAEQTALLGLDEQQLIQHELALGRDTLAKKESEAADLQARGVGAERLADLRVEIELLQERQALTSAKGFKLIEVANINKARDAYKKLFDDFDKAGEAVWEQFVKTGELSFESIWKVAEKELINQLYTAFAKPLVIDFIANLTGIRGSGGGAGLSGGSGGLGKLFDLFGGGSGAGSGIASSLGDFGAQLIGGPLDGLGQSIINSSDALGGFTDILGDSIGYISGVNDLFNGRPGKGIGSIIGAFFGGPIGAFIGGELFKNLLGGAFVSSAPTGESSISVNAQGQTTLNGGTRNPASAGSDAAVAGLRDTYLKSAKALGIKPVSTEFFFAGNTGAQGQSPNFALSGGVVGKGGFAIGETKVTDEALKLAASRAVFATLKNSDLPKFLVGIFDGIDAATASQALIDDTLKAAEGFKTLHDQLLALPFKNLQDLSFGATKALLEASGGLEKFQNNLGTYFDKFFTETEKTSISTAKVSKVFEDLGLVMPKLDENARATFRGIVEGLDPTTEAGAKATAALLDVSGAFDTLATTADRAAKAQTDQALATALRRNDLQDRLAVLTGQSTQQEIDLKKQLTGTTDEVAQSLIRQIFAQEAANAAAQDAAQIAQANADKVKSAFTSIFDGIAGEVQRIKGLLTGNSTSAGGSLAQLKADFSITNAQRLAGDQEAGKRLPGLSQQLLALGEKQAGSLTELRRLQAQTLASLSATSGAFSGGSAVGSGFSGVQFSGITSNSAVVPALPATAPFVIGGSSASPQALITPSLLTSATSAVQNADVLKELAALRETMAALLAASTGAAKSAATTADVLERVTRRGQNMITAAA